MSPLDLRPDQDVIQQYYEQLRQYDEVGATHEGTVRAAFQRVLQDVGKKRGWTLVEEHTLRDRGIRVDGAVKNDSDLYHGYWEAKDSDDDLDRERKKKIKQGYPTKNTVFQAPNRAVLMQDGGIVFDDAIDDPQRLVDLLTLFFEYREPAHEEWERAVETFKDRVPELGQALREIIETERAENDTFRAAFQQFYETCKQAINPNLAEESVEEMLIQHLLTERIFRTVFDNPDFLSLEGIPERAHDYRLGNRSALEWLVNQYKVRTYHRYDITHDPNDPDDKWHIVDLVKRVTTVSVETVDLVNDLPPLGLPTN